MELCNRCQEEMKGRFPMNEHHYVTKIVSKNGVETIKNYSCLFEKKRRKEGNVSTISALFEGAKQKPR